MTEPTRPSPATRRARGWLGGLLPLLSLAWLVAALWATHTSLSGVANDPALLVGAAALALPGVVAAAVPAGAAAGLAATLPWNARTRASAPLARGAAALSAGVLLGAATAVVIIASYGNTAAIRAIALTVGSGVLIGAALATPRQRSVLTAGLWATLAVFLVSAALNAFQAPLKTVLGAGDTVASWASAASRLSFLSALVAGLVAALVGYVSLRRGTRPPAETGQTDPTGQTGPRWPAFLLAGAAPGLFAMAAEVTTRVGGAGLLRLAGDLSEADRAALDYLAAVRVNNALVVGFVGAIGATIAIGRTLSPPAGNGVAAATGVADGPNGITVAEATDGTDADTMDQVGDEFRAGAAGGTRTDATPPGVETETTDPSAGPTGPAAQRSQRSQRPVGSGSPTSGSLTSAGSMSAGSAESTSAKS